MLQTYMETVFQLCISITLMLFSLSVLNVITDSILTKSVPSSDSGELLLAFTLRTVSLLHIKLQDVRKKLPSGLEADLWQQNPHQTDEYYHKNQCSGCVVFGKNVSIDESRKLFNVLASVFRNHAGAVCICAVPDSHHRTNSGGLPVRELRPSLSGAHAARCEWNCVRLPALPTPQDV